MTGECFQRLASYGGLFLIPLPGFIRASRHLSLITGCHGGYVAALSPSALSHSGACWDLNGMIQLERGRERQTHKQRKVTDMFNPSGWQRDSKMRARYRSMALIARSVVELAVRTKRSIFPSWAKKCKCPNSSSWQQLLKGNLFLSKRNILSEMLLCPLAFSIYSCKYVWTRLNLLACLLQMHYYSWKSFI